MEHHIYIYAIYIHYVYSKFLFAAVGKAVERRMGASMGIANTAWASTMRWQPVRASDGHRAAWQLAAWWLAGLLRQRRRCAARVACKGSCRRCRRHSVTPPEARWPCAIDPQ